MALSDLEIVSNMITFSPRMGVPNKTSFNKTTKISSSMLKMSVKIEPKTIRGQSSNALPVSPTPVQPNQDLIQRYARLTDADFVPCLYLPQDLVPYQTQDQRKVFIHFHANGEDVSQCYQLLDQIRRKLCISVIAVEYPGYGIYPDRPANKKAQQILRDAETVFEFVTNQLKFSPRNVIVSGRSIGSGPACHLASKFQPLCLMLISPIKSVISIARQKYGRLAELFVNEHFNNLEKADKIVCPTIIIHGAQDNLVPYQDSIDMINNHLTNSMSHLFLRS